MTEPKTVNVRIAVAVGPDGRWNAVGCSGQDEDEAMFLAVDGVANGEARYWVTATLPIPEAREIAGKMEAAADA